MLSNALELRLDRVNYAARANALLQRVTLSRDQLAREAGVSFRALKIALAPSTAEHSRALPRYLRALANRLEIRHHELPEIIAELRALADEGEKAAE